MSLIDEREAATPGWQWLGYRTWRCIGDGAHGSAAFSPASYGRRYRVTKAVSMQIDPKQRRLM